MFINNLHIYFFFLVLNYFLFLKFKNISYLLNIYDETSAYKLHKKRGYPIGGIIIFLNLTVLFFFDFFFDYQFFNIPKLELFYFFFSLLFLFLLGLYDDKYNLRPLIKLFFLFIIIYILLTFDNSLQIHHLKFESISLTLNLGFYKKFITILFILLFLNAFNMFDGVNLQSGFYSFLVFGFFIIFIKLIHIFLFLILILIFFLYWNYKKNVFLGNSGSLIVSFIISYYFIKFYNNNTILSVEEIYIYMSLPGIDMFRLFLVRIKNRKNPFKGDLNHIHHIILEKFSYNKYFLFIHGFTFFAILLGYSYTFVVSIILFTLIYLIFYVKYK
jgi:UDP-GlcNAc:undecaprenyl-phosphate/decaprenyl-phosphate GlcNAc-1-phosphate transferase